MYDLFDTFLNPWYDDSEYNKKAPKQQAAQTTQNLMKTDILKEVMYFSYDKGSLANLFPLAASEVREIIKMNRNGVKPESLKTEPEPEMPEFITAVGDDSITRFDAPARKKRRSQGNKPRRDDNRPRGNQRERDRRPGKGQGRPRQENPTKNNDK